jgi:dihydroorotase
MRTKRTTGALVLAACFLALSWPAAAQDKAKDAKKAATPAAKGKSPGPVTAVVGADVYTVTRGVVRNGVVLVQDGKILRVGQDVAVPKGATVIDARGKIVTPGLIDAHVYVYDGVALASMPADLAGVATGVTTIIDGGSAGSLTFPGFRMYVMEHAATSVYALLNIATIGLVLSNETYIDPKLINPKTATDVIQANKDRILGIKVRINGRHDELAHDIEVVKKARDISDATGVPIVLHWTNEPDLLALLKRGDMLTHPFTPTGPESSNVLGGGATIPPQILELKSRGIRTDFGHGAHLSWDLAEKAAAQNWYPDALSTGLHRGHAAPNGLVIDLVTTLAKFMYLGLTIDQAIERATKNPASMFKFPQTVGTLREGSAADVSVLELTQGNFDLFDAKREKRVGHQKLTPVTTIKAGRVLKA